MWNYTGSMVIFGLGVGEVSFFTPILFGDGSWGGCRRLRSSAPKVGASRQGSDGARVGGDSQVVSANTG